MTRTASPTSPTLGRRRCRWWWCATRSTGECHRRCSHCSQSPPVHRSRRAWAAASHPLACLTWNSTAPIARLLSSSGPAADPLTPHAPPCRRYLSHMLHHRMHFGMGVPRTPEGISAAVLHHTAAPWPNNPDNFLVRFFAGYSTLWCACAAAAAAAAAAASAAWCSLPLPWGVVSRGDASCCTGGW